MPTVFTKVLIANRGEIALRIVRSLRELSIGSVAVYARDDVGSLHVRHADEAFALDGAGPSAYLDGAAIIAAARSTGCQAIHPGYGFLSERADFARACEEQGLVFIGATSTHLGLFGDKIQARSLARRCGVPVLAGTDSTVSLEQAQAFFSSLTDGNGLPLGIMLKAVGGGGGRGMRIVEQLEELPLAYERCCSEARASFGVEGVYAEQLMPDARHIEIQVLGDGKEVVSLGDRDCSIQRRHQKIVEIAPSPLLAPALRRALTEAALRMCREIGYSSLGTFEFLVCDELDPQWVFIETNPRLQVEHTVTEEVTGLDLVRLQIRIAAGVQLSELDLGQEPAQQARGYAIQWRVNAETLDEGGQTRPASGMLTRFDMPSGPGVRVDTHGFVGAHPSPRYDSLLAKLVVHSGSRDFGDAVRRSQGALKECRIEGLATNLPLLRAIAARIAVDRANINTRYLEDHLPALLAEARQIEVDSMIHPAGPRETVDATTTSPGQALTLSAGEVAIVAPMPAQIVEFYVEVGDLVAAGEKLVVLEAMKMEHVLLAECAGRIIATYGLPGEVMPKSSTLVVLQEISDDTAKALESDNVDLDAIRSDLETIRARHAFTLDRNREAAVAKRHRLGGRTARENLADLCDLNGDTATFIEYGALAVAAQTRRRALDDLIANTPADGIITGIGSVNGGLFGPERSRCAILAYDYTVLAGTQGMRSHQKTDRMLALAHKLNLPVVLFAEGGGGRPGETDMPIVAGLNNHTFSQFAALSGKVPVVGIVHGPCFAGNAALLGCCDVIIATKASFIGMSGPAMIEGGGLGIYRVDEIGPSAVQSRNGVIDVLVEDEAAAVAAAKRYLSYFQGRLANWTCTDSRALRHLIPENRRAVYDIRRVMTMIADNDSLLELRSAFGAGILTALARIEGRPVGIIANNPRHLGGAIDVEAADKAARFMQLCDAHDVPIVSLTDTPGFMVGPDIEAKAQVRHVCRMFVVAAHLHVPYFTIVLRKGYGLGAQAMAAGGFDAPVFTVSWPTGEFGAMGLEGAVKLGFRKELAAAPEGKEREELFAKLVAQQYANGAALNMAMTLEIDAVIDPADTRSWIMRGLESSHAERSSGDAKRGHRFIDTW